MTRGTATTGEGDRPAGLPRVLMYDPYHHADFGAQRSLVALARGLREAGVDAVVGTGRDGLLAERARDAGVPVDVLPIPPSLDVFNGQALRSTLLEKAGLLAGIMGYGARVCGYVVRTRTRVLYANDLRTVLFFAPAKFLPGRRLVWSIQGGPAFGRLSAFAARIADDIVIVSRAASKAVPPAVLGQVRHKLVVNYVGIDASRYLPDAPAALRSEIRERYHLPTEGVLITSAGSICHRKGFDVLLQALELLRDEDPGVHLAIAGVPEGAGSAEYLEALRRRVAEKGLPVTFVGWLDDLRDLLSASDIFALASREEGLGRVTLEAMATRLPAVVTRAGGSEETVVDGESGFVVPPEAPEELADRLRRLVRSPDERARIGANARARCEEVFSLDAFVQRFLALLRRSPGGVAHGAAAPPRPDGGAA